NTAMHPRFTEVPRRGWKRVGIGWTAFYSRAPLLQPCRRRPPLELQHLDVRVDHDPPGLERTADADHLRLTGAEHDGRPGVAVVGGSLPRLVVALPARGRHGDREAAGAGVGQLERGLPGSPAERLLAGVLDLVLRRHRPEE